MSKEGNNITFGNFHKQLLPPLVIFADFEYNIKKYFKKLNRINPDISYTDKYQKHIVCSYGYRVICTDDKFSKPVKNY